MSAFAHDGFFFHYASSCQAISISTEKAMLNMTFFVDVDGEVDFCFDSLKANADAVVWERVILMYLSVMESLRVVRLVISICSCRLLA